MTPLKGMSQSPLFRSALSAFLLQYLLLAGPPQQLGLQVWYHVFYGLDGNLDTADEAWILDTAGCQYGFRDVLVPFEKYVADKLCRISSELITYDATETKDLNYFSTLPFLNKTRAQREHKKLKRQARLHFIVFVNTRVSKNMLNSFAAKFKNNLNGFIYKLKLHILNFIN
jgi:hypothetical protein